MTTPWRALVVALALLALGACATGAFGRRLELPDGVRVYVAVFVDESDGGRVGVPLSDAVKLEVYRRDPARLALMFDDDALALDGTVLSVDEEPRGDGRMELTVSARARLLDKRGGLRADLGTLSSTTSYRVQRRAAESERHRSDALDRAVDDLARQIVRGLERAATRSDHDAA